MTGFFTFTKTDSIISPAGMTDTFMMESIRMTVYSDDSLFMMESIQMKECGMSPSLRTLSLTDVGILQRDDTQYGDNSYGNQQYR